MFYKKYNLLFIYFLPEISDKADNYYLILQRYGNNHTMALFFWLL